MNQLRWLMESFGFSIRQLADMLDLSSTLVHNLLKGHRNLGSSAKKILDHPLFDPYQIDIDEKNLTWADPDAEWRIKELAVKRLNLQASLHLLEKKLEEMKRRHLQYHNLLQHTSKLPFTPAGGESLVLQWWILQRARVRYALRSFTKRKLDKIFIQQALLKAELELLNTWLGDVN